MRRYGRHLENRYDVITLPLITDFDEIWYADGKPHADDSKRVKIKPEVEFQDGGSLFSENGSSESRPWIEISGRNLIC